MNIIAYALSIEQVIDIKNLLWSSMYRFIHRFYCKSIHFSDYRKSKMFIKHKIESLRWLIVKGLRILTLYERLPTMRLIKE